jgi:uncharacterized protein
MKRDAAYWIRKLELAPHPEGGYYRQTYRSDLMLPQSALPAGFTGPRTASTAIYFLLEEGSFSAFHRLRSDELWHFYCGATLSVHVIEPDGCYWETRLGTDPEAQEVLQATVKAGCWFASEIASIKAALKSEPDVSQTQPARFALVGCTVAPGFDFEDFELARRDDLTCQYPEHKSLISRLTRG